jgi:hypothetical protein
MDAAKNDVAAIGTICRELTQLVRIPFEIGVLNHLILLVMVSENQEAGTQPTLGGSNSGTQFFIA